MLLLLLPTLLVDCFTSSGGRYGDNTAASAAGERTVAAGAALAAITTTTTDAVSGGVAAVGAEVGGDAVVRVGGVVGGAVDADLDPRKQAVRDVVAEVQILGDGVEGRVGLENRPHVVVVCGTLNRVGVVWIGGLDLLDQVLWVEQLPNVGDGGIPGSRDISTYSDRYANVRGWREAHQMEMVPLGSRVAFVWANK